MTPRAVRLIVRGHVQGVGFRWFVRERARALKLGGWVRNRPDGSVEVAAVGDTATVDAFIAAVRAGPPRADVLELHVRDEDQPANVAPVFEIRH